MMQRCGTISSTFRGALGAAIGLLAAMLTSGEAAAHPHMFFAASAQFVTDQAEHLTGLRVSFQVDAYNTLYTLAELELDQDNDGKFTDDEQQKIVAELAENFARFNYFTHLKDGDREIQAAAPNAITVHLEGDELGIVIELPLAEPQALKGRNLLLSLYDPSFFTEVTMKAAPEVAGPAVGCAVKLVPYVEQDTATDLKLFLAALSREDSTEDKNYGVLYADKVYLTCVE